MLVQIRRGYTTPWRDLRLSVESADTVWRAEVHTGDDGRTVYSAERCNLGAAKIAAAEFAMFHAAGVFPNLTPEAAARQLPWNEYW